jgi:uncharacterized RDD family membrane protein YckC
MATTTPRDPRTIVTPDAFSVHPPLLGTPLASPSRRGVALLIDVFLVALITALTSGFWFILGVVAAAFFFSRAKKRVENDRRSTGVRFLLGCMGVMALSVTASVFFGIQYMRDRPGEFGSFISGDGGTPSAFDGGSSDGSGADRLRTVLGGFQEGAQLRSTNDPDEAVALAVNIGRRFQELEPDGDIEGLLLDLIPGEVGGVDGDDILDRAMVQLSSPPVDDADGGVQTVDLPSDQADAAAASDSAAAAEVRLAEAIELAEDTIGELQGDLLRARRDLADVRDDLEDTQADLEVAVERRGLIGWFTSRIDSLGFGFGWWTLYFAILMPWMKGQTPGKRMLGVRVVRLDGHPVSAWHAFERAGGYAAGVATGTLGFLQIYWDANRQAIHDKVAGTVVIRDGVPKVPGNWDQQVATSTTGPSAAGPA